MAVVERVFVIFAAGEEVVAAAAGAAAGGDRGGDCFHEFVDFGAVSVSVSLNDAPSSRNFGVLP